MKLIYLHIYKDTYLIFMQAYKKLHGIQNYFKPQKRTNLFSKFKGIY